MQGLYSKYCVTKKVTREGVFGCFVLRPQNDMAARKALLAYAEVTDNPVLSSDIKKWINALEEVENV